MQTSFKLTQAEVNQAIQLFVAKHQRSRNVQVTGTEAIVDPNDGTLSINATAEVIVKPVATRTPKSKTIATKTKKTVNADA